MIGCNQNINIFLKPSFNAFTLAEVLITLGIIGVVAALTIPSLVSNIQDKQFKESAKVAFSKSSQAIQQMKIDNGGDLKGLFDSMNSFKPVFVKYFKLNSSTSVFVPALHSSDVYKSLSGDAFDTFYSDDGQFMTSDGMLFMIENCGVSHSVYNGFIGILVDVNGHEKAPNVLGRDLFVFELLEDGRFLPAGAEGTKIPEIGADPDAKNYCNKNVSSRFQGWGCMNNVVQGIDYKVN